MSEPETPAAATPSPNYAVYWKAWGALLVVTLAMVFISGRVLLIAGMALKASIIAWWFMHLRSERKDFVFYVVFSIVVFSLVLFGLIAPDGMVM